MVFGRKADRGCSYLNSSASPFLFPSCLVGVFQIWHQHGFVQPDGADWHNCLPKSCFSCLVTLLPSVKNKEALQISQGPGHRAADQPLALSVLWPLFSVAEV